MLFPTFCSDNDCGLQISEQGEEYTRLHFYLYELYVEVHYFLQSDGVTLSLGIYSTGGNLCFFISVTFTNHQVHCVVTVSYCIFTEI